LQFGEGADQLDLTGIPRGVPLDPPFWYCAPRDPPAADNGSPGFAAWQGDIFGNVPHAFVDAGGVERLRDVPRRDPEAAKTYAVEASPEVPENPLAPVEYRAQRISMNAHIGLGVLLTQDCELEKHRPMLTFAQVRFIDKSMAGVAIETIRTRNNWRRFYLEEQAEPHFPRAYIDFARLTTIHPGALNVGDRLLSLNDIVRDCMRRDFTLFMMADRAADQDRGR
jgi:hypothetical protein